MAKKESIAPRFVPESGSVAAAAAVSSISNSLVTKSSPSSSKRVLAFLGAILIIALLSRYLSLLVTVVRLTAYDEISATTSATLSATNASSDSTTTTSTTAETMSRRNLSVIAYSVYGNDTRYIIPLLANAERLAPKYYPGWQVRIYHHSTVPESVLSHLRRLSHVMLVDMSAASTGAAAATATSASPPPPPSTALRPEWSPWLHTLNPTTWRFLVASDPTVDTYIVRDSDSLLGKREQEAVREWLESPSRPAFHVMHDHPRHFYWSGKNMTVLAGWWGGRGGAMEAWGDPPGVDMAELLRTWYLQASNWKNKKTGTFVRGDDQNFLNSRLWPRIEAMGPDGSMRHNSFQCDWNDGIAFPTAGEWDLKGYEFVGDVITFVKDDSGAASTTAMTNYTAGWKIGDPNQGPCWLNHLMMLGSKWRKYYLKCITRRSERGFRNTSNILGDTQQKLVKACKRYALVTNANKIKL